MTLRQITLHTKSGPVEVTGEMVTEHFALTPSVEVDTEGHRRFVGGLTLTHTPTGMYIPAPWWSESVEAKRVLARELEAAAVDWADYTPSEEARAAIHVAYQRADQLAADDENSPGITIHV